MFQVPNVDENVIAYTSQKLAATATKIHGMLEGIVSQLAILHCSSQFRPYVEGT